MFDGFDALEEKRSKEFRVNDQTVIESHNVENAAGNQEIVVLKTCTTCNRVLHTMDELHALCGVCDGELCTHCNTQCNICARLACKKHVRFVNQHIVCKRHGFLTRLVVRLFA